MEKNNLDVNQECLSFALRRASRAVSQIYDHALMSSGLRSTQFNLLMGMSLHQAKTLTELALWLVMDRTTLTRNLKPLERAGLITGLATMDKRSKSYALTDKGHHLVAQALPLWHQLQHKIDHMLEDHYRKNLIEKLNHLIEKSRDLL
jgi:DNA-binding MarR family transcriptional regulator